MKTLQKNLKLRRPFAGQTPAFKKSLHLALLLVGMSSTNAMAHIIPTHMGTFTGLEAKTLTFNNGASGNFGWIDGADADWADTHKLATFVFTLTGMADVDLKFNKKTNAFGGTGLIPGFTLYKGAPHEGEDHDYSVGSELLRATDCAATVGCTTTEGSFRAQNTFRITRDSDPQALSPSVFTYVGSAYDGQSVTLPAANSPLQNGNPYVVPGADGVADNSVSLLFPHLAAGNYIVFVGGANYNSQTNTNARGIGATITVTPSAVPVPGAVWLFGSALAGFVGLKRRK